MDGPSFNGTFVDGDRVHDRYPLQDAQVIRVGGTVLLYREGGDRSSRIARMSGSTSAAVVRAAAQVTQHERELLQALAGGIELGRAEEMALLYRRFDVADLPPERRHEVLLRRARALRLLA